MAHDEYDGEGRRDRYAEDGGDPQVHPGWAHQSQASYDAASSGGWGGPGQAETGPLRLTVPVEQAEDYADEPPYAEGGQPYFQQDGAYAEDAEAYPGSAAQDYPGAETGEYAGADARAYAEADQPYAEPDQPYAEPDRSYAEADQPYAEADRSYAEAGAVYPGQEEAYAEPTGGALPDETETRFAEDGRFESEAPFADQSAFGDQATTYVDPGRPYAAAEEADGATAYPAANTSIYSSVPVHEPEGAPDAQEPTDDDAGPGLPAAAGTAGAAGAAVIGAAAGAALGAVAARGERGERGAPYVGVHARPATTGGPDEEGAFSVEPPNYGPQTSQHGPHPAAAPTPPSTAPQSAPQYGMFAPSGQPAPVGPGPATGHRPDPGTGPAPDTGRGASAGRRPAAKSGLAAVFDFSFAARATRTLARPLFWLVVAYGIVQVVTVLVAMLSARGVGYSGGTVFFTFLQTVLDAAVKIALARLFLELCVNVSDLAERRARDQ